MAWDIESPTPAPPFGGFPLPLWRGVNSQGYWIFHSSFFTFPLKSFSFKELFPSQGASFFTFLPFYFFTFKKLLPVPRVVIGCVEVAYFESRETSCFVGLFVELFNRVGV